MIHKIGSNPVDEKSTRPILDETCGHSRLDVKAVASQYGQIGNGTQLTSIEGFLLCMASQSGGACEYLCEALLDSDSDGP